MMATRHARREDGNNEESSVCEHNERNRCACRECKRSNDVRISLIECL